MPFLTLSILGNIRLTLIKFVEMKIFSISANKKPPAGDSHKKLILLL